MQIFICKIKTLGQCMENMCYLELAFFPKTRYCPAPRSLCFLHTETFQAITIAWGLRRDTAAVPLLSTKKGGGQLWPLPASDLAALRVRCLSKFHDQLKRMILPDR